ncbi:MAG: prolipoprotein diacylglyceryl transferase [Candidatus Omnitrophica bacterium]|nr:prolipoprotein diacylglyceryl transferase [Candidatus Omnitrophota bacterium]
MWPVLFKIGNFEIGSFGVLVAFGFFAAYTLAIRRARAAGYSEERMANLLILCLIAGLVGAKLLHVIIYIGSGSISELLFSRRGLVYYGGFIAGVATGWLLVLRNKWDPAHVADILAPAVPLGEFFGRIGCFLNGCCFGRICSSGLGVQFPRVESDGELIGSDAFLHHWVQRMVPPDAQWSLPVYPTQLLSSFAALATFLALTFYFSKRVRFRGQLALIYLMLYSVARFLIEMIRDDPRGAWPGGLSTSQGISVLVLIFATAAWVPLKRRDARVSALGASTEGPM